MSRGGGRRRMTAMLGVSSLYNGELGLSPLSAALGCCRLRPRQHSPSAKKKGIDSKHKERTVSSPRPKGDIANLIAQIPDSSFLPLNLDRPPMNQARSRPSSMIIAVVVSVVVSAGTVRMGDIATITGRRTGEWPTALGTGCRRRQCWAGRWEVVVEVVTAINDGT